MLPADNPAPVIKRFVALDSLRGLAALSVVACHYLILLSTTAAGPAITRWLAVPPLSLLGTAYGSVILFFVLSGYVLALNLATDGSGNWLGFVARRVCRIWLPYAATLLVSFAIGAVTLAASPSLPPVWESNIWQSDSFGLIALIRQIGMLTSHIPLDVPGWSLILEMRISLIFPLLLVAVRRAPATTLAASLCLNIASSLGPPWFTPLVPDAAPYFVHFAVGAWLALNRTRIAAAMQTATARSHALLGIVALLCLSVPREVPCAGLVTGLGATVIIALVIGSPALARLLAAPWCERLGRVSYSLYLTHVVVLMALGALLGGWLPVPLVLIVACPVIATVSGAGYRYVEQPSIRLGRILAARIAARGAAAVPQPVPGTAA